MNRLSRRELIAGAGSTGVAVLAAGPFAADALAGRRPPLLRGGSFREGVLSGDPTPTGITLLTRMRGVEGPGAVALEVARDPGFGRVVVRSVLTTDPSLGHAVKARLQGLLPHRRYWYRFSGRTAESQVGQFRTALPPDSRQAVRFGLFNGQEYTAGFFNAHALLAEEDVDFVVNLGNYIYADQAFARPVAVRDLRKPEDATKLAAYRRRYREYRRDPGLRSMHAAHAMLSCWDDGEVMTGYAGASSPSLSASKSTPYRAWFEAMPHYPKLSEAARVYHQPQFGRTVQLFILDTRRYRDKPPCGSNGDPNCPELDSARTMLGPKQARLLQRRLTQSRATWKIVASPSPVAVFRYDRKRYYGFDSWQGYPGARERLLGAVRDTRDVVFMSGNLRRFMVADVRDGAGSIVAPEFTCGSVSMLTDAEVAAALRVPGYGTSDAVTEPAAESRRIRSANPDMIEHDQLHHGYAVCEASRSSLTVDFRKLKTVRTSSKVQVRGSGWAINRGQRSLVID